MEPTIEDSCLILDPLTGPVDITAQLASGGITEVICGGDPAEKNAQPCDYDWVLSLREQCVQYGVTFHFRRTGSVFVMNERVYHIPPEKQESQAAKAGIDYAGDLSHEEWLQQDLFERIAQSNFRSRFRLRAADRQYVRDKGMDVIRDHAEDFIGKRLAPGYIPNDGKQTPMRGHPVFLAQHSCACCCRGCLEKWHGIPKGRRLTEEEQEYVVDILMEWIRRQMEAGG